MAQTQTETKKAGARKTNKIFGFVIDKLDREAMTKYIAENKLGTEFDTSDDTTDETLAGALSVYFQGLAVEKPDDDPNAAVKCDVCEGVSLMKLSACPFCGDEGSVQEDPPEETVESASAEETVTEEETGEETEETEETDEEDGDDEEDDSEDDAEEESDEEEDASEKKPEPKKKVAKATKKTTEKTKMSATEVNGVSKANGTPAKKSTALQSTKDLDKAVQEVIRLKSDGAQNYWETGQKLLEINQKQLWKLRTDDKGKAKYKGFDAFVHAELQMSHVHAYRMIDVAREYKSIEEVRQIGQTKAALILNAAPKDRAALKNKAKNGATKKELEKEVQKSRAKNGSPKSDSKKAKAGKASAAARAASKPVEKVTVADITGIKTIKLFKLPEGSKRGLDYSKLPRAKRVADHPYGKLELTNGVVQHFQVLEKDGELVLKIETIRSTSSED